MTHLQQIDDDGLEFTAVDGDVHIVVFTGPKLLGYWCGLATITSDGTKLPIAQLQETPRAAALFGAVFALTALQHEGTGHQRLRRRAAFESLVDELNALRAQATSELPRLSQTPWGRQL